MEQHIDKSEAAKESLQQEPAQLAADREARDKLILLAVLLVVAALCAVCMGRLSVTPAEVFGIIASQFVSLEQTWTDQMASMVLDVRIPRIIGAILVGAALSLSGASYQCTFKNPIVSPDILGVSAGACVGAASAILLHLGTAGIMAMSFVGGIVAVLLTNLIPRLFRSRGTMTLVLAGVLVSGFMNSLLSFLKYVADADTELAEITYWTMGSLSSIRWSDLAFAAPIILVFGAILLSVRWRINLLALGDAEAQSLGVNVGRTRALVIVCATALTSTAVCISGSISWVGLIVPHACRLIVGQDNKNLLPASALAGGLFMLIVDTLCRVVSVNEIPLSVFTGLIGVPIFIWILSLQKTRLDD